MREIVNLQLGQCGNQVVSNVILQSTEEQIYDETSPSEYQFLFTLFCGQ